MDINQQLPVVSCESTDSSSASSVSSSTLLCLSPKSNGRKRARLDDNEEENSTKLESKDQDPKEIRDEVEKLQKPDTSSGRAYAESLLELLNKSWTHRKTVISFSSNTSQKFVVHMNLINNPQFSSWLGSLNFVEGQADLVLAASPTLALFNHGIIAWEYRNPESHKITLHDNIGQLPKQDEEAKASVLCPQTEHIALGLLSKLFTELCEYTKNDIQYDVAMYLPRGKNE